MPDDLLPLLPILLPVLGLAGFASGLVGFAFSGFAAVILFIIPPLQAVPLLACLSIANQMTSGLALWHQMRFIPDGAGGEAALPFIVGGVLGVPVGIELLHRLPAGVVSSLLGTFLIAFSLMMLILPALPRVHATGSVSAILTGWLGGVVGGISAFPGAVPSVFLTLRRTGKAETRGTLQPFILGMQLLSVAVLAMRRPDLFDSDFLIVLLATLPAVLAGSMIGVRCFHLLGDHDFRRAMLVMLVISGGALIIKQYAN